MVWGKSRFYVESFSSNSTETFRTGTLLCFKSFRLSKIFMLKRVMSRFFIELFSSRSTEKLRRGNLMCCVSENCRSRKISWNRGEYQGFLLKICCLTVPENSVVEPFSVTVISGCA